MNNIAIIQQGTGRYLFSVPENVTLREGDRVKCSTKRGITDGIAFADSAWVDENVSQLIGKLTGAKFTIAQGTNNKTPLKLVSLGKGNYRLATSSDTTTTTTFEAGETKIQGLKGEYTITETQAPQDYSPLMLPSAHLRMDLPV